MSAVTKLRTCPRCGQSTGAGSCCGVVFAFRRYWRMTKMLIQRVHAVALGQKGLSEEDYRLRLRAVGVESCKQFTREQYSTFMRGLAKLPNAPKRYKATTA